MTSLLTLNLRGNNFESIPESIQHLLKLQDLSLSACKKLKYLPESIKLLPWLITMDLTGCTSLGQNSNSIDHLTAAFIEERRLKNRKWFIFPGHEVPEMMKYKTESGSSLSFSFKLLQLLNGNGLLFYVCAVLDKPYGYILIKGTLMDESGLEFSAKERQLLPVPKSYAGRDRVSNVALCQIRFPSKRFVKGCKYTAKFQFQSSAHILIWSFTGFYSGDGVSKCGVLPSFDHETVE